MLNCNLRRLMADCKLNGVKDVMEFTNLSRNSIDKLYKEINMESIKLETLFTICDSFGCSLSELLEYVPDSKKENNK